MNPIIGLIRNHRSVRKFKDAPLTDEQTEAIITSAQSASTSSNVQAYTIIGVTDTARKQSLARLAGNQAYVGHSGLFLVFCADLSRLKVATEQHGEAFHQNTESFVVATVDAALAAQNAAIAAESLGLGICFIGGIRNNLHEVSELLELPELVYPVFGLTIGIPDQESALRPRLPRYTIYHENHYQPEQSRDGVREYDSTMLEYYKERTQGRILSDWSKSMSEKYKQPVRAHLRPFLESRGFQLD
jgi:FMN reductase (NADPH)